VSDKIASVYVIWKLYLYIGNGQPREPALCKLHRHTSIPYPSDHVIIRPLLQTEQIAQRFPEEHVLTAADGPERSSATFSWSFLVPSTRLILAQNQFRVLVK